MSLLAKSYEDYTANSYGRQAHWRALQIFSAYRLFIALCLVVLYWFNISLINDNDQVRVLSLFLTLFYCFYSFGIGFINFKENTHVQGITYAQSFFDLLVMILLLSNNTTMEAPLGVLMAINMAAISLMCSLRITFFFAAFVTMMLFALIIIRGQATQFDASDFLTVALYGASYFIVAGFGHLLVRRLRINQAVVDQQQYDLRSLEQMNELIIDRMRSGILVTDHNAGVCLMNHAAKKMFACAEFESREHIANISKELFLQLIQWQNDPHAPLKPLEQGSGTALWMPHFISLIQDERSATLIFLDDIKATAQQAQQMKLASLGRFTASIAHELRNPLGAISHAVQLLLEKAQRETQDQRLLEIINTQADRVNGVIKNILNLTRRQQTVAACIDLTSWLPQFLEGYQAEQYDRCQVRLQLGQNCLAVKMDPSQLHQVLTNLLDNALRASMENTEKRTAYVHAYLDETSKFVIMDIIDQGKGLSVEARDKIFEPFFTEHRNGHGLGLYISSELCLANQAKLEAIEGVAKGACFRIRFQRGEGEP